VPAGTRETSQKPGDGTYDVAGPLSPPFRADLVVTPAAGQHVWFTVPGSWKIAAPTGGHPQPREPAHTHHRVFAQRRAAEYPKSLLTGSARVF
jgi:hypothetical protein